MLLIEPASSQSGERVNFEMLGKRGSGACESLMEEQRVLMNEAKGNELGKSTGLGLNVAQEEHLSNPVGRSLGVSVHERRRSADATAVRGADDFDPLCGRKFIGREDVADFVVENFGGGAGQGAQSVVAKHGKVVSDRHSGEFNAIDDFHGRERMDVHLRDGGFDGAENVAIVELRKIAGQAALNADFGGAQFPSFNSLPGHIVERVEISVGLAGTPAEGAEFTSHKTNVGEVDVAVDHVSDDVAGEFGAESVGGDEQAKEIIALGIG